MRCVILQPSYIPWRGYFDQIKRADTFVFYDDVQYDKRGWRNRNRIKTPHGVRWLTIPVYSRGAQTQHIPIQDIRICWDRPWNQEHWSTIAMAYRRAPYFRTYAALLEEFYQRRYDSLADFTIELTEALAGALGISHTRYLRSSALAAAGAKTDRLLDILHKVGASDYLSGPSARGYIEEEKFLAAGIRLEYMQYDYPEYEQLYPPYDPQVSIIDLLFMTGPRALEYIRFCATGFDRLSSSDTARYEQGD
jgi:hypothetical protein